MQNGFESLKASKQDNISVTAFRIISILNMLLKQSCNDKQINQRLAEEIEGTRDLSKDTICIYLNTLRLLGCVITRPTKKNDYKYILKTHPFKLSIDSNEIDTLIEIRKHVSVLCEWQTALEFDRVFNHLLEYFADDTKESFLSTKQSILKRELNAENFFHELRQFENYCAHKKLITLVYNSAESGEKNISLIADKITMENGAFYLYGYKKNSEENICLRIDKILNIKSISLHKYEVKPKSIKVRYKLAACCPLSCEISENESMIERNDEWMVIEAVVTNKFKFFQKILSYGNKCTILSPKEIKEELVSKLKKMNRLYSDVTV